MVLKVGDAHVTEAEFESRIDDIETKGEGDSEERSNKERRRMGDDYASVLMLSQQAVANHLDTTPEVARQLAIGRIQILSDAEFARLMRQAQPTADEISQYYASHLSDYDQVQVRRLFIWKRHAGSKNTKGLAPEDARARADAILQASAAGSDTAKLAEAFKDVDYGLLDPKPLNFPKGELPSAIEKVAFTLKDGEWGQAQDSPDSIILVQLAHHGHRQLGEVSSLIEKRLQGDKMQSMLDHLKKNAGIWMDERYFGAVVPVAGKQQRESELQESPNAAEGQK